MTYSRTEIITALKQSKRNDVYTDENRKRILSDPRFKSALEQLKDNTEKVSNSLLLREDFSLFRMFMENGSRKEFQAAYWAPRKKLALHAMSAWFYGKSEDFRAAEDALWEILNEYSWAPPFHIALGTSDEDKINVSLDVVMTDKTYVIDLLAAETANSISECLIMLGNKLHPLLIKRAKLEIERRIFTPFLERTFFWETKRDNWPSVCSCNVAEAAIKILDDNERLASILKKTLDLLDVYLSGFSPDGVCLEGLGYWNYGFGPFIRFAKNLHVMTSGSINLFDNSLVERIAKFYAKCFFKGKRTVSFADSYTTETFSPEIHSVLKEYYQEIDVPDEFLDFELTEIKRLHELGGFFLRTSNGFVGTLGKPFGTHIFKSAEWYISSAENGVGIAAKGGHNAEPHNHNDVGSFQIYKNGKEIISDLGCGEYTKDYFSDKRYECFAPSSRAHSVPIVNGEYQKSGQEHKSKGATFSDNGFEMDISGAYGINSLSSLVRKIEFNRITGEMDLTDVFVFNTTPTSVCERLVTSADALIEADGVVKITNGTEVMRVLFDKELFCVKIGKVFDTDRNGNPRETTVIDFCIVTCVNTFSFNLKITN